MAVRVRRASSASRPATAPSAQVVRGAVAGDGGHEHLPVQGEQDALGGWRPRSRCAARAGAGPPRRRRRRGPRRRTSRPSTLTTSSPSVHHEELLARLALTDDRLARLDRPTPGRDERGARCKSPGNEARARRRRAEQGDGLGPRHGATGQGAQPAEQRPGRRRPPAPPVTSKASARPSSRRQEGCCQRAQRRGPGRRGRAGRPSRGPATWSGSNRVSGTSSRR